MYMLVYLYTILVLWLSFVKVYMEFIHYWILNLSLLIIICSVELIQLLMPLA